MAEEIKPVTEELSQPVVDTNTPADQDELQEDELDEVSGGNRMLTMLTNLMLMQHDMQKAIIQNIRS